MKSFGVRGPGIQDLSGLGFLVVYGVESLGGVGCYEHSLIRGS